MPCCRSCQATFTSESLSRVGTVTSAPTLAACDLVLTDSGGVQEEAPSLGKPVLVLRRHTERPEAVEAGAAWLVRTEPEAVFSATTRLLDDRALHEQVSAADSPFGDGKAAGRILDRLAKDFKVGATPVPG
ncbi:UDP-N-acetylglucosamine 2-epimerase [Streptomyces netropsis]